VEFLHVLADFVLHLDKHLVELVARFDLWIYAILFLVIFAETGFVVTPFLPGDSLLFGLGALAAVDSTGTLSAPLLALLLTVAAILGNTVNYAIGKTLGRSVFDGRYRLVSMKYLAETERYFERHGEATIVLSRFAPVIRTFAPFVAGIGRMNHGRFQLWNVLGAVLWVNVLLWAGYFFGNIPLVRDNFGIVTLLIIVVSLLPMAVMMIRQRRAA
jgi:membrane-associated protein